MTMMRIAGLSAVLACASIALTGPACADDLNGSYTVTVIDGGGRYRNGATFQWTLTPCGPGCVSRTLSNDPPSVFHLQGDEYVSDDISTVTQTINPNTMQVVTNIPRTGTRAVYQLTKNG